MADAKVDWIIYYADGKAFTSEDGKPDEAPRQGVLVIAVRDEKCGRRILWDQDAYCWQNGEWVPHDRYQCERYIDNTKFPVRLCGYWVTNDRFKAAFRAALNDKRLPLKTSKSEKELNYDKWVRE